MAAASVVVISSFVWAQEKGEIEAELYAGQRGYLDCGLILEKSIGEKMHLGLSGHVVRESVVAGGASVEKGLLKFSAG